MLDFFHLLVGNRPVLVEGLPSEDPPPRFPSADPPPLSSGPFDAAPEADSPGGKAAVVFVPDPNCDNNTVPLSETKISTYVHRGKHTDDRIIQKGCSFIIIDVGYGTVSLFCSPIRRTVTFH